MLRNTGVIAFIMVTGTVLLGLFSTASAYSSVESIQAQHMKAINAAVNQ